jgi:hypothetical protein
VALELRRLVHGDLCGMFDGLITQGMKLANQTSAHLLSGSAHGKLPAHKRHVSAKEPGLPRGPSVIGIVEW